MSFSGSIKNILAIPRHLSSGFALGAGLVFCLSSCGGGGGSSGKLGFDSSSSSISNNQNWVSGVFKPSETFKDLCATPRIGKSAVTGETFPDKQGTVYDEKNWLRSMSNETYLWYSEIVDVSPYLSDSPEDYFQRLKTFAVTSTGSPKDQYHYTEPTDQQEARYTSGEVVGFGLGLVGYSWTPPRDIRVAYVEAGSAAANAGVKRGSKILKVDGIDNVNEDTAAGVDALNNALFNAKANEVHTLEVQEVGAATTTTYTLQTTVFTENPVWLSKTLDTDTGKVGYVVFNSHISTAETQMAAAINNFQAQGVNDLVLDLRYNGGGLLNIASEVAYMIAGAQSAGKTFEKIVFNDKSPSYAPIPFLSVGEYGATANVQLPSLNLNRVFILSGSGTCSASESVINSLRGINVEVVLIGAQTCGKPYGFIPEDNCGTTYSTINFKGVNAKAFGDYADGFIPSSSDDGQEKVKGCSVDDGLGVALGDASEAQLAAALNYRTTGSCGLVSNSSVHLQKTKMHISKQDGLALQPRILNEKIILKH